MLDIWQLFGFGADYRAKRIMNKYSKLMNLTDAQRLQHDADQLTKDRIKVFGR